MKKTKITFSGVGGKKTYSFSENFGFQIKILIAFFVFFLIILIYAIFNLYSKNKELSELAKTLFAQNTELSAQNLKLQSEGSEIIKSLDENNEKIANLQIMAALNEAKNELAAKKTANLNIATNQIDFILSAVPNGFPIKYKGVTSQYGNRIHPISKTEKMHHGIDLRASVGTEIYATADGFVEFAGNSGTGYGHLVIISHNYGFKTYYGHLYAQSVVSAGKWVRKGEIIGFSGNTGYSTGPHLHYEVRFLGRTVNPANFMAWNKNNFSTISSLEPTVSWQELANATAKIGR